MSAMKLTAGQPFPAIKLNKLGGGEIDLSKPSTSHDWRVVVIYRGKWCPFCTEYLLELKELLSEFNEAGIEIIAASADTEDWAQEHADNVKPNYDVGYGFGTNGNPWVVYIQSSIRG